MNVVDFKELFLTAQTLFDIQVISLCTCDNCPFLKKKFILAGAFLVFLLAFITVCKPFLSWYIDWISWISSQAEQVASILFLLSFVTLRMIFPLPLGTAYVRHLHGPCPSFRSSMASDYAAPGLKGCNSAVFFSFDISFRDLCTFNSNSLY